MEANASGNAPCAIVVCLDLSHRFQVSLGTCICVRVDVRNVGSHASSVTSSGDKHVETVPIANLNNLMLVSGKVLDTAILIMKGLMLDSRQKPSLSC
jgi:hypothetical protein